MCARRPFTLVLCCPRLVDPVRGLTWDPSPWSLCATLSMSQASSAPALGAPITPASHCPRWGLGQGQVVEALWTCQGPRRADRLALQGPDQNREGSCTQMSPLEAPHLLLPSEVTG